MKLLAHTYRNSNSPIITIHEALRLREQNPIKWKDYVFFDLVSLRPIFPVNRGEKSSSFTFFNASSVGHGNGSKGISHELVQAEIGLLKDWKIKLYGSEYNLLINFSEKEVAMKCPITRKTIFIDNQLLLNCKSDLYEVTEGSLGVEVTDTNEVSLVKRKIYRQMGELILELKMIPDWHVTNEHSISQGELKKLRARIRGYLRSCPSLGCISKPKGCYL